MINILLERFRQKYRTSSYPNVKIPMSKRYRGMPVIDADKCGQCGKCAELCATDALRIEDGKLSLDLGSCLFCGDCAEACDSGAIKFSDDYEIAAKDKSDFVLNLANNYQLKKVEPFDNQIVKLLGRSLKLRQVSAGGCNACEADTNVLQTLTYDLSRFGIQFVASPRHADGLLVTGPVSKNMELALKKAYDAVAEPKIVVAVGTCAVSGGLFKDHDECLKGVDEVIPVDLYVPGCPPHPMSILDGLIRVLKKR